MTLEQARENILSKFYATWQSRTEVAWESEDYIPQNENAWVRVSIQPNIGSQKSIGSTGSRVFRHAGIVVFQVFTQTSSDKRLNDQHAQFILDIFYTSADGITYRNQRVNDVGIDGAWYQQNVVIDYEYDDIK